VRALAAVSVPCAAEYGGISRVRWICVGGVWRGEAGGGAVSGSVTVLGDVGMVRALRKSYAGLGRLALALSGVEG
jgi:hypothetical protein